MEELSFHSVGRKEGLGSSRGGSKHRKMAMIPSRTSGLTSVPLLLKLSQSRFAHEEETANVPLKGHVEDALLHLNNEFLQNHLPSSAADMMRHHKTPYL